MLKLEVTVMKAIERNEIEGFVKLIDSGMNQETPYIIMNRFGQTLQDIMDERCTMFSIKTVM